MEQYTKRYIKTVDPSFEAEPMTYGEFVDRYGSNSFTDFNRDRDGYARRMHAGDMDWVEKDIFEHIYSRCVQMPFSRALDLVKVGNRVTRQDWMDRGMFIVYQKGYLQIRQADESYSMWTPSMDDLLAEDWMLLEEAET